MSDSLTTVEHGQLETCEAIIGRGLQAFIDVGNALLEIRENRLYRAHHATFEDYCAQRWSLTRSRAYRLMGATTVVDNLSPIGDKIPLPTTESQARPLTSLPAADQVKVWESAVAAAPNGKPTAAHVETAKRAHVAQTQPPTTPRPLTDTEAEAVIWRAIEKHVRTTRAHTDLEIARLRWQWLNKAPKAAFNELLNPGVYFDDDQFIEMTGRVLTELARSMAAKQPDPEPAPTPEPEPSELDSNEWYTPSYLMLPIRDVLGGIDLDPASCAIANNVVRADEYYDQADDGLTLPWAGNIYLNPPYSNPLPWVEKLLKEFALGNVVQAILLVNTANSPQWACLLWQSYHHVCLLNSRIKFWRPDRPEGKTGDRDQMLWYLGGNPQRFREVFDPYGSIR